MASENPKSAKYAWRKKPRKFAPKSRRGCKTCKIRRIKCDLSEPSCLKCQSTGRTCDGYGGLDSTSKTEIESSHYRDEMANGAESCNIYHPCTTITAYRPEPYHTKHPSHIPHDLGSFMVLPTTGPGQAEAMRFFEYISIKHLNEYHPCETWRKTLMYFSQTSPSVRYAAMALALIQRNSLDRDSSRHSHRPQSSGVGMPDTAPLLYYNRAIQLLLSGEGVGDGTKTSAVTLLVCYLFICFDQVAGNYVQAMKHLRAGVRLSCNINKAIPNNSNTYDDTSPSGAHTVIGEITRQISRLDMQAVMFLVDWTPADIQEPLTSQPPPADSPLRSLDQAADLLQILVARTMRLRYSEQRVSLLATIPAPPPSLVDIVLGQLGTWSSLFEDMLRRNNSYTADPEAHRLISLLRLRHTIAWTFLKSYGPGREMEYDNFLEQFRQCVALAGDVAAAHERYSESSRSTYTPEVGILPVLYIIGVKCRHPVVRREALGILRRLPTREAVWNSICTARVVERVIEAEEGGCEAEGMAQDMEGIPVWRRVEALSWVHVVDGQSAARVDITYTFCAQEGVYTESLVV